VSQMDDVEKGAAVFRGYPFDETEKGFVGT
jgi:hypothetical protein